MPFILNQNEEELKKQRDNQNISGSSTVISGNNANLNSPEASANTPKASGSFTNLQTYLDANNEQAAEMGQKIVNDVENSASSAKNSVDNLNNSVSTVNSLDNDYLNTNFYDDPAQANKQNYLDLKKGYTGPTDISKVAGYNDTIDAWNKASDSLKNSSTEAGRQQLLKNTYNNPGYSAGQNLLDQTLVQNNAASKNAFENVQSKWSGLNSLLDTTTTNVGNRIKNNVQTDSKNKSLIQEAEQSAQDKFQAGINDRVNTILGAYTGANQVNKDNPLTDQQLANLGISKDLYNQISNDKYISNQLGNFVTGKADSTDINRNTVATSEDYKRFQALNSLLDTNNQFLYDPTGKLAGTGNMKSTFDVDSARNAAIKASENNVANARQVALNAYRARGGQVANDTVHGEANFEYMLANNPQGVQYYFPQEAAALRAAQAEHQANLEKYKNWK
jgi:hypothetical protein